jgi:hypothetical protein
MVIASVILNTFVKWDPIQSFYKEMALWATIITVWSLIPNALSLWIINLRRASRITSGINMTIVRAVTTLVGFTFFFIFAHALEGGTTNPIYAQVYFYVIAAVMGGVAYIFQAAYSIEFAYKVMLIDSLEAAAFIIPGLIFFLGHMPLVTENIWAGFGPLSDWILNRLITGGTVGALIAGATTEIMFALKSLLLQEEKVIVEA